MDNVWSSMYAVITVIFIVMVALVITNVVLRLTIGSIGEFSEIVVFCLVWIAFLPAGSLESENRHIQIDYFISRLPDRVAGALGTLEYVLQAVTVVYLLYSGALMTMQSAGRQTPLLGIPTPMLFFSLVFSFSILLVVLLVKIVRRVR